MPSPGLSELLGVPVTAKLELLQRGSSFTARSDLRRRRGAALPAADVRVWGVETEGAQAMPEALSAGGPVPVELTSIVSTLSAPAFHS
ncbi:MAG: threonine dehydratase [Amycolatopsis sp.]|nr:threonine dehydratase [Amycolatopsis sp.]